jgi:hypothetical protein
VKIPRALAVFLGIAFVARAEPTFEEINTACGAPLFADSDLWDDNADEVARRLELPVESRTSDQSSFRLYPPPEARFFGARPFSQALLAENGLPAGMSLVFANKGDSVGLAAGALQNRDAYARRGELRENRRAIKADAETLEKSLTALFGPPAAARLGNGRETRENVLRWDWMGHSFLLAAPRGEYVALRIVPSGRTEGGAERRISDSAIREIVRGRVERRPNGDVILRDMPMVNQGPKGYCVPATWERVLRYMGIPADMYVLAMAGGTKPGGGTATDDIAWAVRDQVAAAGRRIESPNMKLSPEGVAEFIDDGLPVIWDMHSSEEFNAVADERMRLRKTMTDPEKWTAYLKSEEKADRDWRKDPEDGHVCMIIGYNTRTGELALSDSWGPEFTERWVTAEEAAKVSRNGFLVIRP